MQDQSAPIPRPCPFCGYDKPFICYDAENDGTGAVTCPSCLATGPEVRTGDENSHRRAWRNLAVWLWGKA